MAPHTALKVKFSTVTSHLWHHQHDDLVVGSLLLRLLEPILLGRGGGASAGLTLNLDSRVLVCLQLLGDVGLLRGHWWRWRGELLDDALGVGGLDGCRLVGLELLEVEVLDDIRCGHALDICMQHRRTGSGDWHQGHSHTLTDGGRGDDGTLGDDLAPREAGEGGALAGGSACIGDFASDRSLNGGDSRHTEARIDCASIVRAVNELN